jgi:large subunit ribosomal protein L35
MPKLKTKGSTKGRFKVTGTGKIMRAFAFKRHQLRAKPQKMKRQARGMVVLNASDVKILKSFLPYI